MGRIRRGDIVVANLEPVIGSEQGGIRPVLIIQNDLGNKYSTTTIIVPITSTIMKKDYPINVQVSSGLKKESTILLNQIRTVDKERILRKIGKLDLETMKKVDEAIKISLDLD